MHEASSAKASDGSSVSDPARASQSQVFAQALVGPACCGRRRRGMVSPGDLANEVSHDAKWFRSPSGKRLSERDGHGHTRLKCLFPSASKKLTTWHVGAVAEGAEPPGDERGRPCAGPRGRASGLPSGALEVGGADTRGADTRGGAAVAAGSEAVEGGSSMAGSGGGSVGAE